MSDDPTVSGRIAWHPAFFEAIQAELEDYRDVLEFQSEYQLTSEPLKIDVLVVKKKADVVITKNIGEIFRSDNLIEYKSPEDYVSVGDFYKVYGYACLYASLNQLRIQDVTISFVETRHPRELLDHLKNERKYREVGGMGKRTLNQVLEDMGLIQEWKTQGRQEGIQEGRQEGVQTGIRKAIVLIKSGMNPDDVLRMYHPTLAPENLVGTAE